MNNTERTAHLRNLVASDGWKILMEEIDLHVRDIVLKIVGCSPKELRKLQSEYNSLIKLQELPSILMVGSLAHPMPNVDPYEYENEEARIKAEGNTPF